MLEPQDRKLLTQSLRPPDGYELSWAVGTTFSMDLLALLTTPLSFALFDWETGDNGDLADPAAMLEALRRYADRLTVFCQAGQISVPKPDQVLYVHLEDSVYEARSPRPGGLFHPKLWVLRFEAEALPVRYRLICLSRNLTFDRTWDTAVVLDGELQDRRIAYRVNHPLGEFLAELPGLAHRPVSAAVAREIARMAQEVRKVSWEVPEGFSELQFHPLGIEGHNTWPFKGDIRRMLVMSPFVGPETLQRIGDLGRKNVLISRLEWLQELAPAALEAFEHVYVLDDAADVDALAQDGQPADATLDGLHAKVYVGDAGHDARVWIGSANATGAAFGSNVEFMVELVGSKWKCGIDAILQPAAGEARLWNLLKEYQPGEPVKRDEVQERLDASVESVRRRLAELRLRAHVASLSDEGKYVMSLELGGRRPKLPPDATIHCWPIRLGEGHAAPFSVDESPIARFTLSVVELTSFFAFKVRATEAGREAVARFVVTVPLEGAPDDRREAALREILNDPERVLRYLLFLLADGDHEQAAGVLLGTRDGSGGGDGMSFMAGLPLFEAMVRALDTEPAKLDHVDRLIADLSATPEGAALIPPGFAEIWEPIRAAREAMAR